MQEVLRQLADLLLGSLPTLILFILLVLSYQFLVQGPLSAALKTRRARTSGAVEHADKAIAAAGAAQEKYAQELRQARAEIFAVRERRLKEWAADREQVLDSARKASLARVMEAKLGLEAEAIAARKTLLMGADAMAEQVVRAVLPAAAGGAR